MKRRKFIQSIIAIILVITTVFSSITVMAEPLAEAVTNSTGNAAVEEQADGLNTAEILSEYTENRGEYTKEFRMSDGTIQAVQYSAPVHFKQNGEWVDYDNSLEEVTSNDEGDNVSKYSSKDKDLINRSSDYTVRLSKKTNGKKFVKIEKDNYKLSWYYSDAKKSTAKIVESKDDGDPTTLENLTSDVLYKDVYKNTDFEYVVGSNGLKENIILGGTNAPVAFTAVYKVNGLVPVQTDNKTIELRAADETVVYVITAPYMEDKNGVVSDGVTLSLADTKNNTFTVKTALDKDWLMAEDREFPVTVDPMLKTNQTPNGVQSAFVASSYPDKCYKAAGTDDMGSLYVGNTYPFGKTESYMKFTSLPALTVADKVVDARFYIGLRKCENGLPVYIKRLVNNWDEKKVTWNNKPDGESYIADYMMLTEKTDLTKFREVEITDMVRGWYSGDYDNYGLSLTTTKTDDAKAWFYSIDYTTYPQNRPLMTITYRNMSGYEDYWSYTDVSAGRGGVASVNNYNGNLIFSQPVTQDCGGNHMPVSLSFVYNSNRVDINKASYNTYVGNRVQTNFHISIHKESGELWNNGYKYYLNDADGTKHWFYFENNSETDGKDEDGLGYSLKIISIGSDKDETNAKYVITDKDENKMYFDSAGDLRRIKNPSGVSSIVVYETVSGVKRIKNVQDGVRRIYAFTYSANDPKLVVGITDPANRKTAFHYSNGLLDTVTFNDKSVVTLGYTGNLLNQIKGIDGTRTKISYDSSQQSRVTSINWGASDSELLEKYSFSYKQNETTITDLQKRSYTYQFNDFGQTTGTVSNTDGSAQFFELSKGNDTSNKANKLLSESRVLQSTTNYIKNPGFTRALSSGYWTYINDTAGASVSIDSSKGNITGSSVKVSKPTSNTGRVNAVQTINDLPGGTYTLSAYVNTNGAVLPGDGVQLFAEIHQPGNGDYISSENIEFTNKTNGWERRSVTFTVPSGGTVRATMGLGANTGGTVWIDDVQLEKSANASSFNLVENSAFTNGTAQWEARGGDGASVTKPSLSGYSACGVLTGSVDSNDKRYIQYINTSGKKGDVFSYGMWVGANSAPINGTKSSDSYSPVYKISVDYYDTSGKWAGTVQKDVNPDLRGVWQFIANDIIMPSDYSKIAISLLYTHNVNKAYLTGVFCYKEQYGQTYDYDKDGNVVSAVDLAKTNSTFSYYGNQMAKMLNPSGSKYLYNYNDKKQLTYGLSSDGQEYRFTYDGKGDVTKAEITSRKPATKIENGKSYILVNAYSGLDINSGSTGKSGDTVGTWHYDSHTKTHQWKAELVSGTSDVFMLKSVSYPDFYMDVPSSTSADGAEIRLYKGTYFSERFKLVKQSDGTFGIFTCASSYNKCLDGQHGSTEIIMARRVTQATCDKNNLKESQKWYFYPVEATEDKTIVTETEYTSSKNFVSSSKDQRGNTTSYSYDEKSGNLQSVTDSNNNKTEYVYDSNSNLLSVSLGGVTNSYTYSKDRLDSINANGGTQYKFEYDKFGRTVGTKVGNGTSWRTLSAIQYNSAGLMSKQTYGNGDYIDFKYDNLDRITEKKYNGNNSQRVTYSYGNNGSVAQTTDYYTGTNTKFVYDLAERVVSQREYEGTGTRNTALVSSTDFTYADKTNYLTGVKHYSALGTQDIGYRYGNLANGEMPDQIYSVSWNGKEKVNYTYDGLGRLTNKKIGNTENLYTYEDVGTNRTTTLANSVKTAAGTYTYTYDNLGNITSISDGEYTTTYEYDSLNQLIRENDERADKTYTYSYSNGNITEKKEYAYTTGELGDVLYTDTWKYEDGTWSDLLTGYNGEEVSYDEIGNPLTIGEAELTWNGRQLTRIKNESWDISYTYNGEGQRTAKTKDGKTTEYFYNGSLLAGQKTGDDIIVFMYDNNGDLFGFTYNGTEYYYVKNLQNDVTAITDSNGNIVVNYYYDAWGNPTSTTGDSELAELNPIRYRSYYCDEETDFYYLNSRYYASTIGRFLNADGYVQTGQGMLDKNMFAYCENNPVNRIDNNGNSWKDVKNWFSKTWNKIKNRVNDLFSSDQTQGKVIYAAEHKKKGTTNPKNKEKHQNGLARKNRDKGGEKGDKRRTPNPNKRRPEQSNMVRLENTFVCVAIVGVSIAIVYIAANDATLIGVIDDVALAPLSAILWECVQKVTV